jgi:phage I-like protein
MAKGVHHVADGEIALATASAIVLSEGQPPEWVKLFPYGTFKGRDGRGPYTVRDQAHAQQIIANTTAFQAGADNPVDYEHQTQRAEVNGKPAPAAGWFKQFEARPDGVYARSDWTATAAQHLVAKEYRYISPTFIHDRAGTVIRIVGAGLTNSPNLDIPAIASQTQGVTMDPTELLKQIRAAFGMAADASLETIAAHCQHLATGTKAVAKLLGLPETTAPDQLATAAQGALAALATTLKVTGETTVPLLATAAQQVVASAGQVDLAKYVPKELYVATANQLTELQGKVATTDVEREVAAAIEAGKITPALKDWAVATASQDLAAFKDFVAKAPKLVATAAQTTTTAPAPAAGQQLTEGDLAVASQLGMTAEEYKKAKAAEEGK